MVISFSCSASRKATWILALLFMMSRVHGQSTRGFVSVDCGLTNSSAYNDGITNIRFDSDRGYVAGGLSHTILAEYMVGSDEQQKTLRSFPDGSRNCYTLPSTFGKKFLLRATFTYGNYDGLNRTLDGSPFLFGLHIGVNFWDTVNLTNWDPSLTVWKEVLTVAPGNSVSVCLINFGSGTPFMSALELRPLLDAMYPFVNTSVSVGYFRRIRFGEATEYITRYPVDPYDRFWEGWSFSYNTYPWINLNTSSQVEILPGDDYFNVPMAIFQKATTLDTNYSFIVINASLGPNVVPESVRLLPIFHFAEINGNNMQRSFDIYNADDVLHRGFSPSRLQASSLYNSGQFLYNGDAVYTLNKARGSSLPPLINAFEVYSLLRMENFTTDSEDGRIMQISGPGSFRCEDLSCDMFKCNYDKLMAEICLVNYIKQVKAHYNLTRIDWNGDPCSPREYTWEGLTCGYSSSNKNPRIVRVNMSSSGLGGGLAISLLNMTSLENFNLANNKLEGPIPSYILRRFQAGLLDLRLEGNPICSKVKDMYCSNKKKHTTPTVLIAVIVPVVLVSLLVVMCILWKLCHKGNSGDYEDYATYEEETPLHIDIRRFTYAELKLMTKDFQSIIGKGGFGIVYHGILENGDEVAVKVLMETSIAKSTDFLPEL
ncbi:hypothetical protein CFC21_042602 [Triticum aestivum]|uniref:Malectin-like domain-containing protein n=3 Tax=Triticum TaxID=4564 RepID=A0A9R1QNX6_TRITD|nr:hypothetical protein CFC21_042602 [Triticum aestivum]VAH80881.1 unnamed protein product [Triticum turgidum subsp. durum]